MNSIEWFISQFPESQFPCVAEHKKDYIEKTCIGHRFASKRNVLFCGIVRNSASVLPYTIARLKRLGSYFRSYHVFLYENDSIDKTKEVLSQYSSNPLFSIISENLNPPPFLDMRGLSRRIWMAKARNQYLRFARNYVQSNKIDYIIVFDSDLLGGWSYNGILNSIGHPQWDVMGSNSLFYKFDHSKTRLFYDSWALRLLNEPKAIEDNIANLFIFNRGEPTITVNSCFGGLAIYKTRFLHEGIDYNESDCDHPTLNNELAKLGYRIYLNPSQITLYNRNEYSI